MGERSERARAQWCSKPDMGLARTPHPLQRPCSHAVCWHITAATRHAPAQLLMRQLAGGVVLAAVAGVEVGPGVTHNPGIVGLQVRGALGAGGQVVREELLVLRGQRGRAGAGQAGKGGEQGGWTGNGAEAAHSLQLQLLGIAIPPLQGPLPCFLPLPTGPANLPAQPTCSSWPLACVALSALVPAGQALACSPRMTCSLEVASVQGGQRGGARKAAMRWQQHWPHAPAAPANSALAHAPHQQRLSLSKRQATMASSPSAGAGLYWHTPVHAPARPPPITAPSTGEPE